MGPWQLLAASSSEECCTRHGEAVHREQYWWMIDEDVTPRPRPHPLPSLNEYELPPPGSPRARPPRHINTRRRLPQPSRSPSRRRWTQWWSRDGRLTQRCALIMFL